MSMIPVLITDDLQLLFKFAPSIGTGQIRCVTNESVMYSLSLGDMSRRHSHENNVCKHNECPFHCLQRESSAIGDCLVSIVSEYAKNEEYFAIF